MGENATKAYVPVRFGEIRLLRPGAVIARAEIRTRRCNERSILADFALLDAEGEVIATIREGRFQALRAKGGSDLDAFAISQTRELATEPTALPLERRPAFGDRLRPALAVATAPNDAELGPGHLLLEGWATALAYRLAEGLTRNGTVDLADPRLSPALRPWAVNALYALESSGLATHEAHGRDGGSWRLRRDVTLPAPEETMRWIASDQPELSAELVLLADTTALVSRLLAGEAIVSASLPPAALDAFHLRSATARASAATVAGIVERSRDRLPRDRALRVLQVGFGPLSARAAAFARETGASLSVLETDRRLAERARLGLPARVSVVESADELPANAFDLVLASEAPIRAGRLGSAR